ncbi:VanZ family protein [Okibacterium sp. HSC-33S16]|uniref:VanZ family protein n=1 Tax=Okibacterium sp. HSC-33S16 TaxID=2910965 RepID=UPI00209CA8B2|nr:VanZ family protein [Okibacterium sp. HSC-33S16]MCP2032170.1 VanZ family protein [Okibacterium sp. HSC-33S16]
MRTPPRLRGIAALLAFAYAMLLALIAFWPTPVDRPIEGTIRRVVERFQAHNLEFVTYSFIESMANVALFLPAGFLLVLILGARRWWLSIVIGVAISTAIELGQHYFLSARFATMNDVLANTAGAIAGTALGLLLLAALQLRDVRRHREAINAMSIRLPRSNRERAASGR